MRTISGAVRTACFVMALMLMALPGISAAAEAGDAKGMHEGHDHAAHAGKNMDMGEKIFSGKVGPWTGEARLIDMKAQMEQSGVSAKTAAKFAGKRHLMLFVTDPATGKPAAGVAGKVVVTGPDKASSSKVTLVVMGEHIGADVGMPTPGKYTFNAEIESGATKGSATFSYSLK
jgi:hypothetical protein